MNNITEVLHVKNISKRFGGVEALRNVNLSLKRQEILGLVGDNGAGKSTFTKILSGVFRPSGGEIFLNGERINLTSPREARERGISTIYQELALCNNLDAYTNIYLGIEIKKRLFGISYLDKRGMKKSAQSLLDNLGIKLKSPRSPVKYLSGGQRQAVAIVKALAYKTPELLILDEPTAGLAAGGAVKRVRKLVRDLTKIGTSIILISHDLEDIFAVTDRIAVFRHGVVSIQKNTIETNRSEIVSHMITAAADN